MTPKEAQKCPNCGHPEPPNAAYCPNCGQKTQPPPAPTASPPDQQVAHNENANPRDLRWTAVCLTLMAIPMAIAVPQPHILITVPITIINLMVSFRAHEKQEQSPQDEGPTANRLAMGSNLITAAVISTNSAIYLYQVIATG